MFILSRKRQISPLSGDLFAKKCGKRFIRFPHCVLLLNRSVFCLACNLGEAFLIELGSFFCDLIRELRSR